MNNKGESMKYKVKVDLTLEDEKLTDSMAATQAQRIKNYICEKIPFSKTLDVSCKREYSDQERELYHKAMKDMLKVVDDSVSNKEDRSLVYSKIFDLAKEMGIY